MKVVMNALQYKNNNFGIGVMIRELLGSYISITVVKGSKKVYHRR